MIQTTGSYPKPKWMRWRTYNRLAERFEVYYDMTYPDDSALCALAASDAADSVEGFPLGNLKVFVTDGGLISSGADWIDPHLARYVDRILKGETPVDLPVRAPTKY